MTASPADVETARLLLARLGVSPVDLLTAAQPRQLTPTFDDYVPIMSAAVSGGTRRLYRPYWNRILEQWAADGSMNPRRPRLNSLSRMSGRMWLCAEMPVVGAAPPST